MMKIRQPSRKQNSTIANSNLTVQSTHMAGRARQESRGDARIRYLYAHDTSRLAQPACNRGTQALESREQSPGLAPGEIPEKYTPGSDTKRDGRAKN